MEYNINKLKLMEINDNQLQFDEQLGQLGKKAGTTSADMIKNLFSKTSAFKSLKTTNIDLFNAINDVINVGKAENNLIKVGQKELTKPEELFNAVKSGMLADPKQFGRFQKGLLKSMNTPETLRLAIVNDFLNDKNVIKDLYGKNIKEITKLLKDKGYSDVGINFINTQAKKNKLFDASGKFVGQSTGVKPTGVKPTNSKSLIDKIKSLINSGHAKNVTKPGSKVKRFIISKTLLGVVLGVAGGVLVLRNNLGGKNVELTDENGKLIDENSQWLPCIQNLIKNKKGNIVKLSDGTFGVNVPDPKYPDGLLFYPNGRVFDGATGKKGTYKCKDGKTQVNEQFDNELSNDVETMIDLLDFPVSYSDLIKGGKLLKKYVDNGKGKEFLSLYQQSGFGGGSLSKSIDYVYAVDARTVQAKNNFKSLLSQIETGKSKTPDNTSTGDGSLDDVEINWDGDKKTDGGTTPTPTPKPKKSMYRNCESKDFPYQFGCINEKNIGKIQKCLGVKPSGKYGYFGPKTLKSLKDNGFDMSARSITKEIYDAVVKNCDQQQTTPTPTTSTPTTTAPTTPTTTTPTNTTPTNTTSTTTPTEPTYDKKRLQEILASGDMKVRRKGRVYVWKGPELSGDDYYVVNKYLTDNGYTLTRQREAGDEDVKYKWKKVK